MTIKWNPGTQPRTHVAWFVESGGFAMYAVIIRPCAGTGYEAAILCYDKDYPHGVSMGTSPYPGYHEGHGARLEACKAWARRWARDNYMTPVSGRGAPATV